MSDSMMQSVRKAARELGGAAIVTAALAMLGFLADPIALTAALKEPPKEFLLLIPAINFAARVAIDQIRHRGQK